MRLAEDGIEFDMRLDVMDGLDIKLEADEELAGIMLEPAVDGLDISTAVRNRTWPVCPCGLPAIDQHQICVSLLFNPTTTIIMISLQ